MESKYFHLSDILSVTTSRLLSDIDGLYDILNFLTGDNLCTHQLPRASDECKPWLEHCFPSLCTPEMDIKVKDLVKMLNTNLGKKNPKMLIDGWLFTLTAKYGEMHEVPKMPAIFHKKKHPYIEMIEMMTKIEMIEMMTKIDPEK